MLNRTAGKETPLPRSGENQSVKDSRQLAKVRTAIFYVYKSELQQSVTLSLGLSLILRMYS